MITKATADHIKILSEGCKREGNPQIDTRPAQVAFESIFGTYLCCLFEPEREPYKPFGKKRLGGSEGGWLEGGWLLQALGRLPAGKTACCRSGVGIQRTVTGSAGIPHSMLQRGALDSNVMSHLRSGFNNAAQLQRTGTTGAIKAARKPSAREPTRLLQDTPDQANRPIRSGPRVPEV